MKYEITWVNRDIAQIRMYMIEGCPTNCFVVRGVARNYIIDTGFGSETSSAAMDLADGGKPTIVINTHYHWDHIWGNGFFGNGIIIGHDRILAKIESEWDNMLGRNPECRAGTIEKKLPNLTFNAEMTFADDGIELFHTPGHSEDSISVFSRRDSVLFAGDNIGDNEENFCPYLDCDVGGYIASMEKCLDKHPLIVVSGHYDVTDGIILKKLIDHYKK